MNIETISIRAEGPDVVLEIEADGKYVELCRERLDAAFSHAVHASGIQEALDKQENRL